MLAALNEKRRQAPAREIFTGDDALLPQYDPSDEAGFDAGNSDVFGNADSETSAASISLSEALERLPADIRRFVRERFHAEFSRVRAPRNVFSYRNFGEENNADAADELADDSDDA